MLFYHSGKDKAVVGIAEVVKAAYPDPTADDLMGCIDLKPVKAFPKPVPLPPFDMTSVSVGFL